METDTVGQAEQGGGSRVASNTVNWVKPMEFQPLGPVSAEIPPASPIVTVPAGMLSEGTVLRGMAMAGSRPWR
jgi:hypothetical protein